MTTIKALSAELLSAIFNTIDSNHQLAECTLVCKQWKTPAAMAMLGNTITITSDKVASKVFKHLFQDPSRIAFVKHLNFELDDDHLPIHIYKLLLLAVHPDIEDMTGSVKSKQFFRVLLNALDSSSKEFTKLQTVPLYTGPGVDINTTVALKLRKSLTFPNLALGGQTTSAARDFLRNLDQFENLDTVALRGHLDGLEWMEDLLRSNPYLEGLGVVDFVFNNLFADDMTRCGGLNSWLASHVRQETALGYIVISSSMLRPEVLQYFSYKYPNLAYIELKGRIWLPEGRLASESDFFEAVDLVLNVVKKIDFKVIQLVLPRKVSLMAAMKYLPSREENIEFSIEEYNGHQEVVLNLIDVIDDSWSGGFLEIFD
ncbi:hypothetical protein V8B55DRAFT_1411133 [Mucor lusitanicus]|uniref:F-box domain-containing protein n=2 Tax=Mucor circinelloides f. lusitanicus TaxID=29924 RepID=A0A162QNS1_MUCCL|nr:hypothetical protein FB192DRAFT_1340225 [Mucor lusitanicus]OAD04500.1 hypothetical protein MUCCIDRAFT_79610 [Mucor lusitanicus CBS 277.49]